MSRHRNKPKRGVALLVVLATITVVLALSYSMIRSQTTQLVIEDNGGRMLDARQAAMAGMNLGLKKMHEADWTGVDTNLAGTLSATESYTVSFTTGDSSLAQGDADYDKYPWRVTLLATGVAQHPQDSSIQATHTIEAVVELVPRKLSDSPSGWNSVTNYTLYQWGDHTAKIELPCRIEGPVHLAGPLQLAQSYPYDAKPFHGTIDEVAVYDDDHSTIDVLNIFLAGITPNVLLPSMEDRYGDRDPIAWWRLDEAAGSTVATDAAGGTNGQYVEADPGVAGIDGTAAHFDGIDDFIDVGTIDIVGDKMTIFAWIKADSFSGVDTTIISKAIAHTEVDHYWSLGTTDVGGGAYLTGRIKTEDGTYSVYDYSVLLPGVWYFVAIVRNNDDLRLYKNGVLVGQTTVSGNIAEQPLGTVFIGDRPPGSSRGQYLRDLNAMRLAGSDDKRPLEGPVTLPLSDTDAASLQRLTENLGVSTIDTTPSYTAPLSFPSQAQSYRLYTGGREYPIEEVSAALVSTSVGPDPVNNPLGVYDNTGDVYLYGNVDFQGTLLVKDYFSVFGGNLYLYNTGNTFSAVDLPPLYGTSEPIQLPAVITKEELWGKGDVGAEINGFTFVGTRLVKAADFTQGDLTINGRVLAEQFEIEPNGMWSAVGEHGSQDAVALFRLQKLDDLDWDMYSVASWLVFFYLPGQSFTYFPEMIEAAGAIGNVPPDSALTLRPESSPVSYHWHNWNDPIFVPHPDDGGLRWDLIRWTDSPDL
ncbi:MAG: LamG domain-containing protein [Planctomycetota bacterium]|nr:MAG: LamG domain-containing protein [Planctomycetota bacterium]REK18584.1 MAG: LamG domain-containing protein [Planctomycetota bacterium]REK37479.1 MAG: LamG domain-containing protein [Planctomycetota bacterium]